MSRPNLQTIADQLGISKMTVSRALRGERHVEDTLRTRILETAAALGYRPDPEISKLMTHMRQKRRTHAPRTLAFVWAERKVSEISLSPWSQQLIQGARQRADQLGFQLDEFYLSAKGMTGRRLSDILEARGIPGFILSPLISRSRGHVSMRWEKFSSVVIGLGYARPALHRVHHHHYLGMMTAMRQLKKLGYKRIGYYGGSIVNERMFGAWSASFLAHHPLPLKQAAELLGLRRELTREDFHRWLARARPDAIIRNGQNAGDWLEEINIPQDLGLVTLDWQMESPDITGVDQQAEVLGAAAVDLLVAQEQQNERGIPAHPKIVMTAGEWQPGKTVRNVREV
ncbi:LacI family fructose operon transcriptional repressor [Prosthecobacter fusiformis]|uniref:LacI family fructose operon transcriptional repressor n=1 Tax=Prosthecobacter fusiformis TaxID=48464 RepID=A0A4R7RNZ4_9BACT|nr:LacI family DNA-binding transcriptional regulator [Prosthecobacter fusiformis]TDU67142.1 LacI family fructose operon transcriptional repressor [Prosthecobacter fusiformis]